MRVPSLSVFLALAAAGAPAQDEVRTQGMVEPGADIAVKARVDGYVSRVFVKPGDAVKVLDKLAVLSAPELHAEVGRATAALAQETDQIDILTVELEIAKKRLSIAERDVKVSSEELPKAKETLDTRDKDLKQAEAMVEAGVLNPRDLAEARVLLAGARAAWLLAGEKVKNSQDEVEIARLAVRRAELAIVRQRSRVDEARADLEIAKIRAGFAEIQNVLPGATVTDVLVAPGSLVVAGETPLVRLMALDRVRIVCDLPMSQAEQIKVGNPVRVLGQRELDVEVSQVGTVRDSQTGLVRVEILIDNSAGRFTPGARADVVFHPQK